MLLQIAYHSRNLIRAGEEMTDQVKAIISVARANNEVDGLTGYLLVDGTWFVQILEGDESSVRSTYDRIRKDVRHTDVTLISERRPRARSFPEWSMGGTVRTEENETIFLRHGIGSDFDPRTLTGPSIVALAMDLQDQRRAQRAAKPARPSLQIVPG